MSKVLAQSNYQIIPFEFDGKIEEIAERHNVSEKISEKELRWKLKNTRGRHLFSYINNLICEEDIKSRIAIALELNFKECDCSSLGIINKDKFYKTIGKGKESYKFKYDFINVYLFETGVGFLVYSLEFLNDVDKADIDIDHVIGGNYYYKKYNERGVKEGYLSEIEKLKSSIKESETELEENINEKDRKDIEKRISRQKNRLEKLEYMENTIYNEGQPNKKTKRTKWINVILEDLNLGEINFIGTEKDPSYSHVFSYINLEENVIESDIRRYLYWLKNSYKRTYKPTEEMLKDGEKEGSLKLFENVWWGTSLEGVSCISKNTDDTLTNSFINSYGGNINDTYLYMYILMLHMRYALLKYIIEASDINKEVKNYKEADIKKINELKEKIILLDLRCIFNDVSNISSQVKVFDMMRKSLRIDRLNEELYKEIENLGELANMYYQNNISKQEKEKKKLLDDEKKREEKKQKQQSKSLDMMYFVIALLSVSGFVKDMTDGLEIFKARIFKSYPLLYQISVITIVAILIFKYKRIKKS